MNRARHPAVSVTAGFFLILWLQRSEGGLLRGLFALVLLLAVWLAPRELWRSVRRLRFVFLALFVIFVWQTPGTLVFPSLANWSPSFDGLRLFIDQGLRLAGVVAVVSILLARLNPDDWLSSLSVLLEPLRLLRVPSERFVVRLRLVLEYAGQRELDWRQVIREPGKERLPAWQAGVPERLGRLDRWLLVLVLAGGTGVLVWLG